MLGLGHRERKRLCGAILLLASALSMTVGLSSRTAAADYRLKVLHHFCHLKNGFQSCGDKGEFPSGGVIMDGAGNLYGTAGSAVFELTPNAARTAWTETVLYSPHCPRSQSCFSPNDGVIMDGAGNLYGTTTTGGAGGEGAVFELTPSAARTAWTETVLFSFCNPSCASGSYPRGSLVMDSAGNLYGTTSSGGASHHRFNGGTVFELTPNAARTAWTETVLYSFCNPRCADGWSPVAGLIMDGAGNLYGTTSFGGLHHKGTVFELTPNASRTAWTETVLFSGFSGPTGNRPVANLLMDGAGNLYGTTEDGGDHDNGTVFELTPNASRTAWTETVLNRFCRRPGCVDGAQPEASLIMDAAGNLYGTTTSGGTSYNGVVFELTPDNMRASGWAETVLHQFCPPGSEDCPDGAEPSGELIMDTAGNLYGTTGLGGIRGIGGGVVFELVKSP